MKIDGKMNRTRHTLDEVRLGARIRQPVRDTAPADGTESRKGVQSVDIVFSILRVLERADRALTLGELARLAEQQPSKVHHYLVSLIRTGMVTQKANGRYDLGTYALQLGLSALSRLDVVERGSDALTAFRDDTGEAAFLAVWGNRGPTVIRYVEGTHLVTVEARAGLVLPLLTSATGRAFLSWLPESVWRPLADLELSAGTEPGLPQPDIEQVRASTLQLGAAAIQGDLLPRIAAISTPAFRHDGSLACVLTTLGLIGELDTSITGPTAIRLHEASQRLSTELGYAGPFPELSPLPTQRSNQKEDDHGKARRKR
jgi:DNA-binding IclR family transcriptional regulator